MRIDMSEYGEKFSVSRLVGAPSRLHRLRAGRAADRGGAPPPVLGDPARRGREGAPRGLRRAAAGARRRPADRRPGPHRRLPQHDPDPHLEPRQPVPGRPVADAGSRSRTPSRAGAPVVQAGVRQPARRHRRLLAADRGRTSARSSRSTRPSRAPPRRAAPPAGRHPGCAGLAGRARLRPDLRGPSAAPAHAARDRRQARAGAAGRGRSATATPCASTSRRTGTRSASHPPRSRRRTRATSTTTNSTTSSSSGTPSLPGSAARWRVRGVEQRTGGAKTT